MKKQTKIISIVSIILVFIIGVGGYFMYQKEVKEKAIKESIDKIAEIENSFSKTETHEEKLNILKSTRAEMEDYMKSNEYFKQVDDKYKAAISMMQESFIKEYDVMLAENTLSNLDTVEDISAITNKKDFLSSLLFTIELEKEDIFSSDDDFESYQKKITELTEAYTTRITALEEAKKKAEEEAKRKAEEEKAKTHYENAYFSVDVPKEWIGAWSMEEEKRGTDGTIYQFSYNTSGENNGGGARIFVVDAKNGLPQNGLVISEPCDLVGYTSQKFAVFKGIEAGAGFFFDGGASITLK